MSLHYQFLPDAQLYDFDKLSAQLQDSPATRIPLLKQALALIGQRLDQAFYDGADIRDLVYGRAWALDQLLTCIWRLFPWPDDQIALVAVGGYGRGELHPHSDIDLLFLLEDAQLQACSQSLTDFLTLLWDIKLEVGHGVRTLAECRQEAEADITVMTNLLENRLITGSTRLHAGLETLVQDQSIWPSAQFFQAKLAEQQTRHQRFNNTEYNLEPNVKSSPGGLRDIQMIGWVAKRHFNVRSFAGLHQQGFITSSERRLLQQGQCFLWQVRYALHMLSGREEDRLSFDYQRQLAVLYGYLDNNRRLAVEQFMKRFFRVVTTLIELNDMLLQHFEEQLLQTEDPRVLPLNKRFQVHNGRIEVCHPQVFEQTPFALIEIFLLMAEHPEIRGVRATTIRAIRNYRYLIDEAFRQDLRVRSLFMTLLRSGSRVPLQLELMSRYGLLGRYLPEFGYVVGLMQHDLFHIYTVDAHTLKLLHFLQSLYEPAAEKTFALAHGLIHQLPKLELLWLAGLYHDLGKGRGGDHSELGSQLVLDFCAQHQLSTHDTHLVSWLIRQHLLFSITAQKQDLSDPEVIRVFAEKVGDQMHLDYLYLLTLADINATNPTLWNGWRASLLNQLYHETSRALRRGLTNPVDRQEWLEEIRQQAKGLLLTLGAQADAIERIWATLDEDYFLQVSPSDLAWQTLGMIRHQGSTEPLVMVAAPTDDMTEGGTKVFIHAPDAAFGFAATAAIMDRLGLSIHDARIHTSRNGLTLNTLIVLEQKGDAPRDPERLEQIRSELIHELKRPDEFPVLVQHHVPRQLKFFNRPTQVTISNDLHNQRTLVEVVTPDRPGLLARIGQVFLEFDLWLQKAKIATFGDRVEDIFYITQQDGSPLSDPEVCQRLQTRLCDTLDRHNQG